MYSLSILLSVLSVLSVFLIKRKLVLPNNSTFDLLYHKRSIATPMAILFFSLSIVCLMSKIGMASAVLASLITWMLSASVITLFEPVKQKLPVFILIGILICVMVKLAMYYYARQ